jgi:hypothetical protein
MRTARTLSIRKSPSVVFKIALAKAFELINWVFLLELLSAVRCPLWWTAFRSYFPQLALKFSRMEFSVVVSAMVAGLGRVTLSHPCCLSWSWSVSVPWSSSLIGGAFLALCAPALSNNGFHFMRIVVIFLSPVVLDLVMIRAILDLFRQASGFATNTNKVRLFRSVAMRNNWV